MASVSGRVQGVGFRAWTRVRARAHGLAGTARNLPDGRVEVVAEGPRTSCEALLRELRTEGPGRVHEVVARWETPRGTSGFTIG